MSNKEQKIKIGTRGSPLALMQTEMVRADLARLWPALETEIVVIRTSGDWSPADGEARLSEAEGGKGLFAKEIEAALLEGGVDIAVHSMKDMDSVLPEGLVIDHMLPRADARDALFVREDLRGAVQRIEDLPAGAVIGTSSVRRAAFLHVLLSKNLGDGQLNFKIVPLRGNVRTRLDKVRKGQVDATFLALAGISRLGFMDEVDLILSPEEMLPAAGQGAVGIEMRAGDLDVAAFLAPLSCAETVLCVKAERAALRVLDGSCHTPIGAYAVLEDGRLSLRLRVSSLDGAQAYAVSDSCCVDGAEDAAAFGAELAVRLKAEAAPEVFV